MTRRITHLIKESESRPNLFNTRDLDVEVARTQGDSQKTKAPTPDEEEVYPRKESQQREVTMTRGDKNQNGKRNTETKLTRKKDKKLSKKRNKIKKLQKVPEGTSQKENLQNWNFIGISEQHHMALRHGEAI
jgi:hypothetical protein